MSPFRINEFKLVIATAIRRGGEAGSKNLEPQTSECNYSRPFFFYCLLLKYGSIFEYQMQKGELKMNKKQPSLIFCILMDLVGYATYSIPFLGEIGDIIWAPISSLIFMSTFGGWKGVLGGFGNFIEELLPGTDFIPSFTIMWFIQNMQKKNVTTPVKLSR